MLGLSLWEGRLPGQKTIENEDKAAMGSYRPESNFGTSDTVVVVVVVVKWLTLTVGGTRCGQNVHSS